MRQIVAITILLHLAFAGSRVTLSLFALHLGASTMTVGLLISLLAALPLLFSVGWGRAIDRIGVRMPMLAGACTVLAATLLAAALPHLATLFLVSAAIGSGFMAVHICVSQMAGLLGAAHGRTRNFSLLALAFSTSGFLGPMLAGFAIDAFGHRITFLLLGLSAAVAIVWLWLRPLPEPHAALRASGGDQRRIADLLRIPALRRAFVASTVLSMAWDLFTFVTPIHGTRLGLSASAIGLILGCFGGAIFLVRLVLPLVVHRLREWPLLIGAMIATGAGMAVFPLLSSVPLLMLTAFLIGIAIGGTQPMIMAVLYNAAPEGRGGEVVGVRTFLLNVTQAGMPLLFGIAGTALGMAPVFWVMAAVLFAGSVYGTGRQASK
jgi:predicted MFS family arabinose efflux permease